MRTPYRLLLPAERFIFNVTFAAMLIDGAGAWLRGIGIAWLPFTGTTLAAGALVGLGLAYRKSQRSDRIAAALVCTGLFIAFSLWLATYNYMLMPVIRPPMDVFLARLDTVVDYRWPEMIALAAQHPVFNTVLKFIYMTTLPQVALMIVVLGLTDRIRDLHTMCLTIAIGATITILFWGLFPSIGPAWLSPRPDAADLALVRPLLGVHWGSDIHRLVLRGVSFISPDHIDGIIAFPSFHTVLALVVIYFSRNVRWLFPVTLVVNLLMLPALLIHGSHHLVDVPGGVATFLLALAGARRVMAATTSAKTMPARAAVAGVMAGER